MNFDLWKDLTHISVTWSDLAIRAVAVYVVVVILLRIAGKRQMGQMSGTEFVALLLISNAVQNAMNAGDNSLLGGLFLAAVLIITSWSVSWVTFKSKRMQAIFEGTPTLLIHRGRVLEKHLKQERLNATDLKILLRKQDVHRVSDVQTAILEADGSLSLIRNSDAHDDHKPTTPSNG